MRLLVRLAREREGSASGGGGSPASEPAAAESASSGPGGDRGETRGARVENLTPREKEVLKLLTQGQTNPQIARNLLFSVSTVKAHVRSILAKLGVSDRTQAAVRAIEFRLTTE